MLLPLAATMYKGVAIPMWYRLVRSAELLRGKMRVTDVNPPITLLALTAARFPFQDSLSRMSSLRQQLEDDGYVIVSPAYVA